MKNKIKASFGGGIGTFLTMPILQFWRNNWRRYLIAQGRRYALQIFCDYERVPPKFFGNLSIPSKIFSMFQNCEPASQFFVNFWLSAKKSQDFGLRYNSACPPRLIRFTFFVLFFFFPHRIEFYLLEITSDTSGRRIRVLKNQTPPLYDISGDQFDWKVTFITSVRDSIPESSVNLRTT